MAALYLDHNVSTQLAPLLGRAGHDVVETRTVGSPRATDDELLLAAADADRVFITHNERDFILLHDAWRRWSAAWGTNVTHAGILILPQPPRLAHTQATLELDRFLSLQLSLSSELYLFRMAQGWERRPASPS